MKAFWFDLDLVLVVIFVDIRFPMPKLVKLLLKENSKKIKNKPLRY